MLVYRSDAPLPEVFRPLHQTPSSHRPFINSHPDPADFAELSDESSDEEPLKRRRVRSPKPALVVPKNRGQLCARGGLVEISGNQSSSLVQFFQCGWTCCSDIFVFVVALDSCLIKGE